MSACSGLTQTGSLEPEDDLGNDHGWHGHWGAGERQSLNLPNVVTARDQTGNNRSIPGVASNCYRRFSTSGLAPESHRCFKLGGREESGYAFRPGPPSPSSQPPLRPFSEHVHSLGLLCTDQGEANEHVVTRKTLVLAPTLRDSRKFLGHAKSRSRASLFRSPCSCRADLSCHIHDDNASD